MLFRGSPIRSASAIGCRATIAGLLLFLFGTRVSSGAPVFFNSSRSTRTFFLIGHLKSPLARKYQFDNSAPMNIEAVCSLGI
jgi:hypothetical protein